MTNTNNSNNDIRSLLAELTRSQLQTQEQIRQTQQEIRATQEAIRETNATVQELTSYEFSDYFYRIILKFCRTTHNTI